MGKQSKKQVKAERDEELARLGITKTVAKKVVAAPSAGPEIVENEQQTEGRMLEDVIEDMRRNLNKANLTRVTPETFAIWYAKKKKEKAAKNAKKTAKREKDIQLGKVAMTGRELFERKRNVFVDDDRADEDKYDNDEILAVFVASLEEQMKLDAESNGLEFDEEAFKIEREKGIERIKRERAAAKLNPPVKRTAAVTAAAAATSSSAPPSDDSFNLDSVAAATAIDESLFNEDDLPEEFDDEEDDEEAGEDDEE